MRFFLTATTRSENAIPGSFVKSTNLGGGTPFEVTKQKHKINENLEIFHHFPIWTDFFVEWVHFFNRTIVTQSLLDLKTSFLRFLEIFGTILKFQLSKFSNKLKIWNSAWSLQRGVPPPRSVDFTKRPRKSHFQIGTKNLSKSEHPTLSRKKYITFWSSNFYWQI